MLSTVPVPLVDGLARTQLEYLRMPAETEWSWVEAYGALHLDVAAAASDDWAVATGAVAADLASRDLPARLEAVRDRDQSRELVVEVIPGGSGRGAVRATRLLDAHPRCGRCRVGRS
jgi:hypothetical protein